MIWKILIAYLICYSQIAGASTRYVSDVLYIPVRTGASLEHKILGYLKSGDRVNTKKIQDEYSLVVSEGRKKKLEGWVKTRYLLTEPIAAVRLESYKEDMENISSIKKELAEYKKTAAQALNEKESIANQLERIKNVSSNAVEIDQKNQALTQELDVLKKEMNQLKEQNLLLQQNQRNEGIKLGILAIALGALIGFALPFLKPRQGRRRNSVRLR